MNAVTAPVQRAASSADLGSVQGQAAVSVLKKALNQQGAAAMKLLDSLPKPTLADSGTLGTQVNTFA